MLRPSERSGGRPSVLTGMRLLEHQTREGVVSEVHEDLRRHPQEAEGSEPVNKPFCSSPTSRVMCLELTRVLTCRPLQVGLHTDLTQAPAVSSRPAVRIRRPQRLRFLRDLRFSKSEVFCGAV